VLRSRHAPAETKGRPNPAMRLFLFPKTPSAGREAVLSILERVAEGTDTRDLVVALYRVAGRHQCRGTAYVDHWVTPEAFLADRGSWKLTKRFGVPPDLPGRFKLIRMRLDGDLRFFPRTERDGYHWEFRYDSFEDQLAVLFAHELHHFRRHHLGLHPRGGERSANRWALSRAQEAGFPASGKQLPVRKPRFSSRKFLLRHLPHLDPFAEFRPLRPGCRLLISRDPNGKYLGQAAELVRPVRSNSKRLVVRTEDGKVWRWPMAWLTTNQKSNIKNQK
jgi:hypothetical protein